MLHCSLFVGRKCDFSIGISLFFEKSYADIQGGKRAKTEIYLKKKS